MSAESWFAISVLLSLVLTAANWAWQYHLVRKSQRAPERRLALEDSHQALWRAAIRLQERVQTSEFVGCIPVLSAPGEGSDPERMEVYRRTRAFIESLPTREDFRAQVDDLLRALMMEGRGLDTLNREELVPRPLCDRDRDS